MGFIESFIKWLILVFITALILYCVFYYMFGWFNNEEIKEQKSHRKIAMVFIISIMIILIANEGISTFMNTNVI